MGSFPPFSFDPTKGSGTPQPEPVSSEPQRPKRRGRPPSIGIRLSSDGKADVSNMTPEQQDKIRQAIDGTSLLSRDDKKLLKEQEEQRKASFKPLVKPFLSLLGTLESAIVRSSRKCPKEQADIFKYSDEEIKILEDPTAAVIAKHGDRLAGYQEEVALLLWWSSIFQEKLQRFDEVQRRQSQAKETAAQERKQKSEIESLENERSPQRSKTAARANGGTVALRQ